jgi:hypothetical protein
MACLPIDSRYGKTIWNHSHSVSLETVGQKGTAVTEILTNLLL